MFEKVVENFRQATEATIQLQQEMFKKWISLWPIAPASATWGEQAKEFQKKWTEAINDLAKKQAEVIEAQFKAGLANIEKTFKLAEAKTPEDLRTKSLELWQQCFDNLRLVNEAQLRGFEAVMEKWCGTGAPPQKK
jgi:Asp-tRNA(Asn)/Glu-tRNA(Gln) amidotransferase A subunit family amidase